jgi:hypothetical protein
MSLELKVYGDGSRLGDQQCVLTLDDEGLFISIEERGNNRGVFFTRLMTEYEVSQLKNLVAAALDQISMKKLDAL